MEHLDPVTLARLQFAMTALYHFLFVPLTLGLSFLLAIMESAYVMTGRPIWRDMTRFWGKLFGINFAMGVATGITMEFQFGTNWAYYSHYVGDIFGAPLAIEGLMAFFLESTFVGLFFFGWDRLSKLGHLTVTWLVAIGSSLSALVDPDRQRLDAESGRRAFQSRHDADGADLVLGSAVQPDGAIQIRAYGQRRLRHRLGVHAGDQRLLPAPRAARRLRQALDHRRVGLRPCLGAVGRRARRRERLHDHRKPEDEARRDRGDVEDRAGAGAVHAVRAARSGDAAEPLRGQDSLGARPHRHPLDRYAAAGHRRSGAAGADAHQERPRRL